MEAEKQKAKKTIITLTSILVGALAVWLLFISLSFGKYNANSEAAKQVIILETKKNNLVNLRNLTDGTKEDRARLETFFVGDNEHADFIERIESLAKAVGVSFVLNAANEDKETGFDFSIKGSFASIYRYLILMENLPNNIKVDKLDLQSTPTKQSGALWTANFTIKLVNYQ